MDNPCLTCGACCAFFRVTFYWSEADPATGGTVPPEMVENLNSVLVCMAGTNRKDKRCVALEGKIGERVACSIYEKRSTPCREFGFDWENGNLYYTPGDIERCNHARAAHSLPPLNDIVPAERMIPHSE